jgi:hypothetical protein
MRNSSGLMPTVPASLRVRDDEENNSNSYARIG